MPPKALFLLPDSSIDANSLYSFDQEHNRVVALKVIDVDTTDYKVNARAKDDTIYDTVHEIKVLSQLKDSKAKNVNTMFDAFQVHSQLWIVNDYCPGGSVHTLVSLYGLLLVVSHVYVIDLVFSITCLVPIALVLSRVVPLDFGSFFSGVVPAVGLAHLTSVRAVMFYFFSLQFASPVFQDHHRHHKPRVRSVILNGCQLCIPLPVYWYCCSR